MLKLQSFVLKWCCQLLRFGDYIFDMIMHMFYKHWNLVEFKFLCMKILLTLQKDLQHLITVSNITSDNRLHFCISFWLLHSMKSRLIWYFTNSKISLNTYLYGNNSLKFEYYNWNRNCGVRDCNAHGHETTTKNNTPTLAFYLSSHVAF